MIIKIKTLLSVATFAALTTFCSDMDIIIMIMTMSTITTTTAAFERSKGTETGTGISGKTSTFVALEARRSPAG